MTYGFHRSTAPSRSWETTGDTSPATPHCRQGSALAHKSAGTKRSGTPRRSIGRSSQTPRVERHDDRHGRSGTLPPVPGRPIFLRTQVLVLVLSLLLFALITWQVVAGGPLVDADRWLLRRTQHTAARFAGLRSTGQFLCDIGNAQLAVPLLTAAIGHAAWRDGRAGVPRWWPRPLAAALAMAAVPLIVTCAKTVIARPSPGHHRLGPGSYPGFFPSGHTASATVAIGAAALLVLPYVHRAARRRLVAAAAVLLVAAVGVSLVWCGYHWPLDVVGSWCLSAALLAGVALTPPGTEAAGQARRTSPPGDGECSP
ncbi:phosphatase PAP2 family protein [Streptomyces sp. H10-C2]|uniref:phosphatase PAP2 family protein n=1 Tax=unclassified Streptomyces TaxID=2593676 RepID=UPI0024B8EBD3|nr:MULTISPECIES: phosphatase PAP2 family protein [unclassified Streptomyces]MDJ0343313.1 phosphatase PAP2 family protein [Streptomyces sp. PH10-H1]MDJ0372902.1 phosphatase PAP2 family protein [Streptomyces sp. H10-C2]